MRGAATPSPAAEACQAHHGLLDGFNKHRRYNTDVGSHLAMDPESRDLARAIGNCATSIGVEIQLPEGEAPEAKLRAARLCNRRLCPFCEARRVKGWRRRFFTGLPAFHEDFPTHKPVFLTLTQRNVPLGDLRQTLNEMNDGWSRLRKCSFFPTPFWFRRTEITVRQPAVGSGEPVTYHPHFHVLLLVPAGYFSHGYVKQSQWQQQWQMAGRYDYPPVVDVRRIRSKTGISADRQSAERAATLEVAKYSTKATDLLSLGSDLGEYNRQIRGLRFASVSSSLRPYISAGEISEEEMLDGGDSLPVESLHGTALWFEDVQQYLWQDLI